MRETLMSVKDTMLFWWLAASCLLFGGGARELDPAACAARFDVQRDKIIRTEESRDMGARYLSELDVGTRHECRRLCCETDSCDVFVYEEKSPGSCYLFNCGPPEDFRCKFTAHSNFSSGVLALSRRLAELQDQERLAMVPAPTIRVATSSTTTTTPSTTPALPPPPPRPSHPSHPSTPPQPARRCSRYQFECHTSGECIAVYNACDGIPQCADGSDEAPELGCPAASAPLAPIAPVVPPAPVQRPPPQPVTPMPTLPPPHHQSIQDNSELSSSSEAEYRGNGAGSPAFAPVVGTNGEHWPHRLTQAQPQTQHRDRYTETSNLAAQGVGPHIFSHKGGLLQEPDTMQYAPFEPPAQQAWPRRVWAQNRAGMESMEGMPGGWGASDPYARPDWPDTQPRRSWPVPQPRPEPDMSMYMPAKTMPEMPIMYSSQQHTLRDAPKKGVGLEGGVAPAPPTRELPPERTEKVEVESTTKKKVENLAPPQPATKEAASSSSSSSLSSSSSAAAAVAASGVVMAHSAHESPDDHDGLSEHPSSAVFLLVLGVAMTSVMCAMLACRARTARRRLRRGKSSFAHDADYLVNGMYL